MRVPLEKMMTTMSCVEVHFVVLSRGHWFTKWIPAFVVIVELDSSEPASERLSRIPYGEQATPTHLDLDQKNGFQQHMYTQCHVVPIGAEMKPNDLQRCPTQQLPDCLLLIPEVRVFCLVCATFWRRD
jgi:hypothetical protein